MSPLPNPDRPPPPGDVRLSVVVPAFQEQDRIAATVASIRHALGGLEGGLEVVVVDDGSTDATAATGRDAGADQVVVHPRNLGKGAAVRTGMLAAHGRAVAFTDADLAYPPSQLEALVDAVESGWDVVVGSRAHAASRTLAPRSRVRALGGRAINWFTRPVLRGRYRDTQCGIKAFRSDAARLVFTHSRVDGFAFDIELFVIAERNDLRLVEVPVTVSNTQRSTVHVVRDAFRLVVDLVRIRRRAGAGVYDASGTTGVGH